MSDQPVTKSDVWRAAILLLLTACLFNILTSLEIMGLRDKLDALEQQIRQLKK